MSKFYTLTILLIAHLYAFAQPSNDICTSAISLTVDGSCQTFSNSDATASNNPTNTLSCGFTSENDLDVWFSVQVPSSGNLTIQSFVPPESSNWRSISLEVYAGTCQTLDALACSHFGENSQQYNSNGLVELTDLSPGSILYIRAANELPTPALGTFDICVEDSGHTIHGCKIQLIEAGPVSICDPITNTFSQEITVHYYEDGTSTTIGIWNNEIELTGSPMTLIVNDIAANNSKRDLSAVLKGPDYTDCWDQSRYRKNKFFAEVSNCFNGIVENDDCLGAINLIASESNCPAGVFDMTGSTATDASITQGCKSSFDSEPDPQDVWFKATIPETGELSLYVEFGGIWAKFDAYIGSCDNLIFLDGCSSLLTPMLISGRTPGEIIFIRVSAIPEFTPMSQQGDFEICANIPQAISVDCFSPSSIPVTTNCSGGNIFSTDNAVVNNSLITTCSPDDNRPIWLSIDIPISGDIRIIFEPLSGFRASIELFESDCSNLTSIGCYTLIGGNPTYISNNILTAGETVLVRVATSNRNAVFSICATSTCPDTEVITRPIFGQEQYNTYTSIEGENVIAYTADVVFNSSGYIQLNPGFEIQLQGTFETEHYGCN